MTSSVTMKYFTLQTAGVEKLLLVFAGFQSTECKPQPPWPPRKTPVKYEDPAAAALQGWVTELSFSCFFMPSGAKRTEK